MLILPDLGARDMVSSKALAFVTMMARFEHDPEFARECLDFAQAKHSEIVRTEITQ